MLIHDAGENRNEFGPQKRKSKDKCEICFISSLQSSSEFVFGVSLYMVVCLVKLGLQYINLAAIKIKMTHQNGNINIKFITK